jgi:microcystin-dependent protein
MDININKSEVVGFQNNQNYIRLHSGVNGQYQIVSGNTLSSSFDELYISLESDTAVEGSRFDILLRDDLALTDTKLYVVKDYVVDEEPDLIKTIERGDVGVAINSDKGVSLYFLYTNGSWLVTEQYAKLPAFAAEMFTGSQDQLEEYFSASEGIKKPYKGYLICNGSNGTPNLIGKFPIGYDPVDKRFDTLGKTGGNLEYSIKMENIPRHSFKMRVEYDNVADNGGVATKDASLVVRDIAQIFSEAPANADPKSSGTNRATNELGGGASSKIGESIPMEIIPKFAVVLYVKRNF